MSEQTFVYEATKDPADKLSYQINWASEDGTNDGSAADTGWLQGDTVTASVWTVPAGLTLTSHSFTTKTTKAVIDGGDADAIYVCYNDITTAQGLEKRATLIVRLSPAQVDAVISATGYASSAEADVVNARSTAWARATAAQKTAALSWSRVYLDRTYSMSEIDPDAPPDALKEANSMLAAEHLVQSLFERQSVEPPVSAKTVKAGSAEVSKTYNVANRGNWVDPFPHITALLYGTSELLGGSSVAVRAIMRA